MLPYSVDLNNGTCACRLRRFGQVQPLGALVIAAGHDVRVSIPIKVTHANLEIVRNAEPRDYRKTLVEQTAANVQKNSGTADRIRQNHIRSAILVEIRHLDPGNA